MKRKKRSVSIAVEDFLVIPPSQPRCIGCGKTPDELEEYVEPAKQAGLTPAQYVREEEGTYNRYNGHFACTDCYWDMGMPSSPRGWIAP